MGLNYLLYRHQVEVARAGTATCREARHSHRRLAAGYAQQVDDMVGGQRSFDRPLVPLGLAHD